MIRVLVVLNNETTIDVNRYQVGFHGMHLVVARESPRLPHIICQQNPEVIVSIGEIDSESSLWALPLWRRWRWLNLPHGKHSPTQVRGAALSLLAATCDSAMQPSNPMIGAVCLSHDPRDVAFAYAQIHSNQLFENVIYLLQESHFDEVVALLHDNQVLGALYKIPDSVKLGPLGQIENAAFHGGSMYVWPISRSSSEIPRNVAETILTKLSERRNKGVILAPDVSQNVLLDGLSESRDMQLNQLFVCTDVILKRRKYGHHFPLESLSGLVAELLSHPQIEIVKSDSQMPLSPPDWWNELNSDRDALLGANVRLIQQHLSSTR